MSCKNIPFLNAAGLAVDIYSAIQSRLRGEADEETKRDLIMENSSDHIVHFVEKIDNMIWTIMTSGKKENE